MAEDVSSYLLQVNHMKVYVKNVKCSGLKKRDLVEATKFYASALMSKRLSDSLTIFIEINDQLGYAGLTSWQDDYIRPKEFSIELNPDDADHILQTLAHEMVHVKQFARGELRDLMSEKDLVNWKGKRYKASNDNDKEYRNYPWEIEAYSLEKELYEAYIEYINPR
jgi:hypothetical protein